MCTWNGSRALARSSGSLRLSSSASTTLRPVVFVACLGARDGPARGCALAAPTLGGAGADMAGPKRGGDCASGRWRAALV